ncbi:hypothetical protein [Couchioplanes caeruleus]|nr:hypothetical protein [Couchioplanes caeruleus]
MVASLLSVDAGAGDDDRASRPEGVSATFTATITAATMPSAATAMPKRLRPGLGLVGVVEVSGGGPSALVGLTG